MMYKMPWMEKQLHQNTYVLSGVMTWSLGISPNVHVLACAGHTLCIGSAHTYLVCHARLISTPLRRNHSANPGYRGPGGFPIPNYNHHHENEMAAESREDTYELVEIEEFDAL